MKNVKLLFPEPKICFTLSAYLKQKTLVDIAPAEVTWLGVVEKIDNLYIIEDIIIPRQEVTSITCEIDSENLCNYMDLIEKIRFWGHSHANMGVSPSGTDEETMRVFNNCDFFIRMILNKRGEYSLSFYDYQRGVVIEGLEYEIWDENIRKEVEREFKEKVKEKIFQYQQPYQHPYYGLHVFGLGDEINESKIARKKKK